MKRYFSRPVAATLFIALTVAALLWVFDRVYGGRDDRMTRVGGMSNECTCSQRLER